MLAATPHYSSAHAAATQALCMNACVRGYVHAHKHAYKLIEAGVRMRACTCVSAALHQAQGIRAAVVGHARMHASKHVRARAHAPAPMRTAPQTHACARMLHGLHARVVWTSMADGWVPMLVSSA